MSNPSNPSAERTAQDEVVEDRGPVQRLTDWRGALWGFILLVAAAVLLVIMDEWSLWVQVAVIVAIVVAALFLFFGVVRGALSYVAAAGWAWLILLIWVGSWGLVWVDRVSQRLDFVDEPSVVAMSLGAIAIVLFAAVYLRGRLPRRQVGVESTTAPAGITGRDAADRIREAIATTFIVVFLLLVIDLLTIPGFRGSLSDVANVDVSATNPSTTTSEQVAEVCPSPSVTISPSPATTTSTATPAAEPDCVASSAVAVSFVDGLFGVFKWAITAMVIFYFGAGAAATISEERTKVVNVRAGMTPSGEERATAQPAEGAGGPEEPTDVAPPL